jgi:hypothetical protein
VPTDAVVLPLPDLRAGDDEGRCVKRCQRYGVRSERERCVSAEKLIQRHRCSADAAEMEGRTSAHYQCLLEPLRSSRLFVALRGGYHRRPMSSTINRDSPRGDQASIDKNLARLLDSSVLARVVPQLPPETLHQLVRDRGLDACGDLLTAATPAQLTALLDLDLWGHPSPGHGEQFDPARFGEWLEALVDAGHSAAARIVAAMDTNVVVAGLSCYLRVLDPGIFEPVAQSDDEPMDRHEMMHGETSRDAIECEVGGYLVRARRSDAWDAIVTLLVTLDAEHRERFHALMNGCRALSNSTPEVDGLDDLLMAPEQHLHVAASERQHRRARRGYAAPAEARAFLQLARVSAAPSEPASAAATALASAYFRAVEEDLDTDASHGPQGAADPASPAADPGGPVPEDDLAGTVASVVELLAEVGVPPARPRALLPAVDGEGPEPVSLLRRLMAFLRDGDERAYLRRTRELAFLANTLQAGCAVQSRPFTPGEASDAAACTCNLGLECWSRALGAGDLPDSFLAEHDLLTAFEAGWAMLYRDVSLFVADRLILTLSDLHGADADTERELGALRRRLASSRQAGTPWLARDAADVLASLDVTAWVSLLGLLDECPVLPEALTAVLERRTTPVDPHSFQFIASAAQLGDVRVFMTALPAVLSR